MLGSQRAVECGPTVHREPLASAAQPRPGRRASAPKSTNGASALHPHTTTRECGPCQDGSTPGSWPPLPLGWCTVPVADVVLGRGGWAGQVVQGRAGRTGGAVGPFWMSWLLDSLPTLVSAPSVAGLAGLSVGALVRVAGAPGGREAARPGAGSPRRPARAGGAVCAVGRHGRWWRWLAPAPTPLGEFRRRRAGRRRTEDARGGGARGRPGRSVRGRT